MKTISVWRRMRYALGKKLLGREYRKLVEANKGAAQKFLRDLDYKLIHDAYKKYALAVIREARESLEFPPPPPSPLVSIIIPVYNQYAYTMRCLQSLVDTTTDVSYEVILADDNSTDETRHIQEHVKNILVVKNTPGKGFLSNCNHAAQYAKGKYIYLLNNDTQVFPKTVSSLAASLECNPNAVIVGSKCVLPDGKMQAAGMYWDPNKRTWDDVFLKNPLLEEFNLFAFVDHCTGASLMVRRDFWEEEKGFDEQFAPGYFEETDLCARAKFRGFNVAYQPESEIIHFASVTFANQVDGLMAVNTKKFYEKWKTFLNL